MMIPPDVVGIDVSKHTLDIFDATLGRAERVDNTPEAAADLARRLSKPARFAVFEATGRYDVALRLALQAQGVVHARVNPGQARDFAKAAGFLAKTDAVDARMLARLGQALRPRPAEPRDPVRDRLARLHKRRDQLVAVRKQERTRRAEAGQDPDIALDIDRHLTWLDQEIDTLEDRVRALIAQAAELERDRRLISSVPGVGPNVSATLLALVPELGQRSPKAIAALVGLAPFNHDSGQMRGQRAIRGGRRRVREALYMAAVAASRSNSRFAATYKALRSAGKPPKLALIAVARKIIITANAVLRDQRPFVA